MELPVAFTSVLDNTLEFIYGLEPLVAPTVVLVPGFLKDYVAQLAEMIGFDDETLSYTLGLFICYPLGLVMNALPYGKARHVFSLASGAFMLQFILGVQWIHHIITSLAVYAMFQVLPRKTVAAVVPTFVMMYCVLGHLHRQYINYLGWDLDFTGTQMILTQQLFMMAYNLYDGEVLASGKGTTAAKKCEKFALKDVPDIIEYLGYTFCFSSLLSGPANEFATYKSACEGTRLYNADGKPKGKIPSNVWPTLRPLLTSLVALGLFVVGGSYFPLQDPTDAQKNTPAILTEEFLAQPWVIRYIKMWMGLLVLRQKYYFAWRNAEGANNIWYAGFDGFDEKGNALGWETCNNMNIVEFETAPNVSTLSREWNKKTSLWLNKYVYVRTKGSLLAVYSISAFWHGFYPGYYLFFLSVPLLTFCERLGKKKISPNYSSEKWSPYGILCILTTSFFVEYMVSAFALLAFDRAWGNWKSHFFFGHIGCVIAYLVLLQMPSPKKKHTKKTQ